VVKAIKALGRKAIAVLLKPDEIERLFATSKKAMGPLDILVLGTKVSAAEHGAFYE
jgi:hypothetical protein